jgi:hypothetical protein
MSESIWQKIDEVFPQVADLPEGERDARLRELCADDDALRREISALLRADEKKIILSSRRLLCPTRFRRFSSARKPQSSKRPLPKDGDSARIASSENSARAEWAPFIWRNAPTANFINEWRSSSSKTARILILICAVSGTSGRF